ncbi:MAG: anti-sigma factor [Bacteroidota bacterium]|nr:anti-sigma factor [Bacteroidota bacterium]
MKISCKEASELIEMKQASKLSFSKSLSLKIHLIICKTCALYEKQSKIINKAIGKYLDSNTPEKNEMLKKKIISKLK